VLLANADFPAKSMKELIAMAKAKPGHYQYASAGNGTLNHLLGEMLNSMAGIDLQHVPYKGVAPALNDVLGGQLPLVFASLPSSLAHIKAGKLKPLAVSSPKRSPALPDVPALSEVVPGYTGTLWIGLFAPAGVPADVQAKLQDAMGKTLAAKDLRDKLELQGVEMAAPTTPEQFATLLNEDIARWAQIVKTSGASID
jgi:tripartite-type tricarboxylate transporter receptor subunit TctC